MAKLDILDPKWVDMVFANKNREYGAYKLRKGTSNRNILALAILLSVALAVGVFLFLKIKAEERARQEALDNATELQAVDQEQEEQKEEEQEDIQVEYEEPPVEEVRETQQFVVPEIKEVIDESKQQTSVEDLNKDIATASKSQEGSDNIDIAPTIETPPPPPPAVVEEPKPEPVVEQKTYTMAEVGVQPSFPGGDAAMYAWLSKNLQYPPIAQENGIQGTVVVSFTVGADGSIKNIKVARGKDPALDKEAVRVVSKMPKWSPGKQNGQNVPVSYTLPVKFQLQ